MTGTKRQVAYNITLKIAWCKDEKYDHKVAYTVIWLVR